MSKRPASAAALPAGQQRLRLDFFNGEKKKQATSGGPAGAARGQPYRGDGGSAYTACPVKVPLSLINHHLDSPGQCGGPLPVDTGAARAAAAVRAGTAGAAAAGAAAASVAGPAADIAAVSASRAAAAGKEAGAPSVCPIGMAVVTKSRCLGSSAVGHSAPRERPRPTEAEAAAAAAAAAPAVAGPAPATLAAADICSVYHYDYDNDDNGSKGTVERITEIVTSQEDGDVMLVEEVSAEGTAVAEAVRAAAAQAAAAQAAAATVAAAQPGRPGGTERMPDVDGARRATTVPAEAAEAAPRASAPSAARAACGGPPESKTGAEMHAAARGAAGAWQPASHQAPPKDQGQGQGPAAGSGRRTSPLPLAQPRTPPQPTNQPPAPPQPPVHAFFQARRQRPSSGSRNGSGGGGGGAAGGLRLGADENAEPGNGVEEEEAGGVEAAGGALCGRQRVPPPLPAGDAPPLMRVVSRAKTGSLPVLAQ
ncbi:hypothetical protein CHLRE_09g399601v5 [Chlamydomonas reinhardtii]|uniref:Uncharacterized protein n=1 Tax=Chlamydomonas reinhardtii TaxID=3055 RepID=A0A2K3DCX8_CHLRE|nr:uncharacterized protein CHLRE_09g399601v5 [Chlamydomonas reinhardtii]PNW78386.1 hypothetical protein CHLRE_09g399601v5 [Chlamydomonas reinhardtii]